MKQGQKGFTLLEMLLATAITGVVITIVAMTTTTLLLNTQQPIVNLLLLQQIQNAGHSFTSDIQMSSNVTLSGPNGFTATVNIAIDQDENNNYDVEYLLSGANFTRKQYDNVGGLVSERVIAQHVVTANTTLVSLSDGLFKLTVQASLEGELATAEYEARRRLAAETVSE